MLRNWKLNAVWDEEEVVSGGGLSLETSFLREESEMVIHWCQNCKYHETRESDLGRMSHCRKENCWSRYSKCLNQQAMEYYLAHQRVETAESFSSVTHLYSQE